MAQYISEFDAPSILTIQAALTLTMICLVMLTWLRTQRVPWARVALLIMATGWTLFTVRTVALGAIVIAPLLASALQSWLPSSPIRRMDRSEPAALFSRHWCFRR